MNAPPTIPLTPDPVEQMLDTLASSRNAAARRRAAAGLGADGGVWAVRALLGAARADPAATVRAAAAAALAAVGLPAVPDLARALLVRPTRRNAATRDLARGLLARLGGPAVPAVAAGLDSEWRGVRTEAIKALAAIGPPAVDRLLAGLRSGDDSARFADALARIGPAAVPGLVNVLAGPAEGEPVAWVVGTPLQTVSTSVRCAAATALGRLAHPAADAALRRAWATDGAAPVREHARRALLDHGATDLPERITRAGLVAILTEAGHAAIAAARAYAGFDCFGTSIVLSYDLTLDRTEFADRLNALGADIAAGRYDGPPPSVSVGLYRVRQGFGGASVRLHLSCPDRPDGWAGVYRAEAFDDAFVDVLRQHGITGWLVGTRLD